MCYCLSVSIVFSPCQWKHFPEVAELPLSKSNSEAVKWHKLKLFFFVLLFNNVIETTHDRMYVCVCVFAGGQRHYLERGPFLQCGSSGCRLGGGARLQSSISRTEGSPGYFVESNVTAVCWTVYRDWNDCQLSCLCGLYRRVILCI